jgi:MFS family permease
MGLGVGIWSVATALSGMVRSYGQLLLGRALVGVGEASYGSVAPAMLSDAFEPAHRGRALAVFSMAIPVGSALGYLLGGMFERAFGWRAAFFIVGSRDVAWPGPWAPVRRARGEPTANRRGRRAGGVPRLAGLPRAAQDQELPLNCLAMTGMTFAVGGLAAWVPTYLVRSAGWGWRGQL